MIHEVIDRTCKPKGHDIDFEDVYSPPNRVTMPKKQIMRIKR